MGVLVTFESKEMLLQREDFPAALRALKKLAKSAGSERQVLGLLGSFAALTTARFAQIKLAYASTPGWWITLAFTKGELTRHHDRRAS